MTGGNGNGLVRLFDVSTIGKVIAGGVGVGVSALFLYVAGQMDSLRDDVDLNIRAIVAQSNSTYKELQELRAELRLELSELRGEVRAAIRLSDVETGASNVVAIRQQELLERLHERIYQLELTINTLDNVTRETQSGRGTVPPRP